MTTSLTGVKRAPTPHSCSPVKKARHFLTKPWAFFPLGSGATSNTHRTAAKVGNVFMTILSVVVQSLFLWAPLWISAIARWCDKTTKQPAKPTPGTVAQPNTNKPTHQQTNKPTHQHTNTPTTTKLPAPGAVEQPNKQPNKHPQTPTKLSVPVAEEVPGEEEIPRITALDARKSAQAIMTFFRQLTAYLGTAGLFDPTHPPSEQHRASQSVYQYADIKGLLLKQAEVVDVWVSRLDVKKSGHPLVVLLQNLLDRREDLEILKDELAQKEADHDAHFLCQATKETEGTAENENMLRQATDEVHRYMRQLLNNPYIAKATETLAQERLV